MPKKDNIIGTLIFLKGSEFDKKNKSAKTIINKQTKGFAVLSISTEILLVFYSTNNSSQTAREIIKTVFKKYNLPNENIFLLRRGL